MGLRIAGLRIAGLLDTVYGEQNCWQRSFGAIQTSICLGYEICIIFWILMSGLNISSHLCLYMLKPLPRITRYHSFCQEYRYCRCWISRTHQLPLHNNASEHDVESNEHGTMVPRNRLLHFWILFLYSLPLFFLKKKRKKRDFFMSISLSFFRSLFLWGCFISVSVRCGGVHVGQHSWPCLLDGEQGGTWNPALSAPDPRSRGSEPLNVKICFTGRRRSPENCN